MQQKGAIEVHPSISWIPILPPSSYFEPSFNMVSLYLIRSQLMLKAMRFFYYIFILLVGVQPILGQGKLDRTLKKFNSESVPYVQVEEITDTTNVVLFDTRKKEEYDVSHLKQAVWVGHKKFDEASVIEQFPDKNTPIIVYCSIGVRSENIGEKLLKLGYTDVKNLYGGIFEWKNQGKIVYNTEEVATDSIHAFSKHWGKLLHKGIKVYKVPKVEIQAVD